MALQEWKKTAMLRTDSRGDEEIDMSEKGVMLEPLGRLSSDGKVIWNNELIDEIKKLTKSRGPAD